MSDRDAGEEIVHDLGLDPSIDIDSDQRAELLQRWHQEDAERERERKEAEKKKPPHR